MKLPTRSTTIQVLLAAAILLPSGARAAARPKPMCHVSADYLVITRGREGDPGNDIIVRAKSKPSAPLACAYAVKPKDYVLGKGESADYLAMHGRLLALDAGTGPDRRLLIFDVAVRKRLVDAAYVDGDITSADPAGYTFWVIDDKPIDPKSCPADWRSREKDASSAHAIRETFLGFADGIVRATGKVGCTRTQGDM